ncbi:hypothetical protein [Catellatospora sichuanensis]|uniref:hypothetical protein n=1 Tax=Catellatospora sichuanensis TaxID=1969805 RepID=UPI001183DAFC|nr:hypothetical protein [Catellatospora sichuanensis]
MTEIEELWDRQGRAATLVQLAERARSAIGDVIDLNAMGGRRPPHPQEWRQVKSFLNSYGGICRILNPGSRKQKADTAKSHQLRLLRGEELRRLLRVAADSPLLNAEIRNKDEHFDEYFDQWQARQHLVTADEIEAGQRPTHEVAPVRRFHAHTWTIEVAGESLALRLVYPALLRLEARCRELEPLAGFPDPQLAYLLATMPQLPVELRLDAPTRRPHEGVMAGAEPADVPDLEVIIGQAVTAFRKDPDEPAP